MTVTQERFAASQAMTVIALAKCTAERRRTKRALAELHACRLSLTKGAALLAKSEAQVRLDAADTAARVTVGVLAGVTRRVQSASGPTPERLAYAILLGCTQRVLYAQPEEQNEVLSRETFSATAGGADPVESRAMMLRAAQMIGMPASESGRIIDSAMSEALSGAQA